MISKNKLFGVKFILAIISVIMLASIIAMTSCGGGGAGGGTSAGGGVSGTGRSSGSITGFGSVFVNGIEFVTGSNTTFNVNDVSGANETDLKVGMKVTVDYDNNVASLITYEPEVKGPVSSKGVNSFTVLGQNVIINSETQYCFENDHDLCNFNFIDLNNGDFVEVSGFFDSNGNIIAAMIIIEDDDPGIYEVKGIVAGLNANTFTINSLTVDYSGIANPPVIADGDFVEVEGILNGLGVLVADSIEIEGVQGTPGMLLELEGIVTQYTSQVDFEVNGQKVKTNSQTKFEGDPSLIALNVKIEVEGTIDSAGVLVADEVEIEDIDIED